MNYKILPLVISVLLLNLIKSSAQGASIIEKISTADSVILVSHEYSGLMSSSSAEKNKSVNLISNGKLNSASIRERKKINTSQRDSLIKILSRPLDENSVSKQECFEPHHAILIFKNNKLSYIDICFSCNDFRTSKDINIWGFDQQHWKELVKYFKSNGIKWFPKI
jgi:hypothetical protein